MGRAFTYSVFMIMLTMMLQLTGFGLIGMNLMSFIGFNGPSTFSSSYNIQDTSLWNNVFGSGVGFLALILGVTMVVGIFARVQTENYVVLGFIVAIASLFTDSLFGVLALAQGYPIWLSYTIGVLFISIGVGYIFTMVEWFRGNV